jgi:hypothetical protein
MHDLICLYVNSLQILDKKYEYNETIYQLFVDFKKACVSVREGVLCNTLIVWGTHETSQAD